MEHSGSDLCKQDDTKRHWEEGEAGLCWRIPHYLLHVLGKEEEDAIHAGHDEENHSYSAGTIPTL